MVTIIMSRFACSLIISLAVLSRWTESVHGFSITSYFRTIRQAVTEQQPIKLNDLNATFYLFHTEYESVALKKDVTSAELSANLLQDRRLVCITHGYMDKYPGKEWIESMKRMIFTQLAGQVNVVVLDWRKGSIDMYPRSAASTRTAGKALAQFILALRNIHPINLDHVHLIGHSLGAHLSGFAGKHMNRHNATIGKITGLDPAGPLFTNRNCSARLCSGDAKLVTVLHTDSGSAGFGTAAKSGDVDVYLNGGKIQPGCQLSKIAEQSPRKLLTCNHRRAHQFFIQSLHHEPTECEMVAYQCDSFKDFESGACGSCEHQGQTCRVVGFGPKSFLLPVKETYTKPYFLLTNAAAPFCTYLYRIILTPGIALNATKIRIEMLLNDAKKVTLERSLDVGQNVTYLLRSSESLGRIEHATIINGVPDLIRTLHVDYLSHSEPSVRLRFSSKLCPIDSSGVNYVVGQC